MHIHEQEEGKNQLDSKSNQKAWAMGKFYCSAQDVIRWTAKESVILGYEQWKLHCCARNEQEEGKHQMDSISSQTDWVNVISLKPYSSENWPGSSLILCRIIANVSLKKILPSQKF